MKVANLRAVETDAEYSPGMSSAEVGHQGTSLSVPDLDGGRFENERERRGKGAYLDSQVIASTHYKIIP